MLTIDVHRQLRLISSIVAASLFMCFQESSADSLSATDLFNSISYSGSNGTAPWKGNWAEVGENNGVSSGLVRVVNDSNYCVAPNCLRLGGNNVSFSNKGIRRAVDLSGADGAVLKFSYRRQGINNRASGSVRVQASKDGSSWTTLDTISFTSQSDSGIAVASYDLANFATANTHIRFSGNGSHERGYMFIDNVDVSFNTESEAGDAPSAPGQKMAIPAYFQPGPLWDQLENGAPTVGLAVINPSNGPGSSKNQSYANEVSIAQARGVAVMGYVHTGYGQRSASTVNSDIAKYFQWYDVKGIFVDETSNQCSKLSYYQSIFNYVKSLEPSATVVINPGNLTQECYVAAADIILNFEDVYSAYVTWQPMGWEKNYPAGKFWHLIHATSSANMPNAVNLAKSRNAGWTYVTPDKLPNPWDTLPSEPYWTDELNLISQ